MKQYFIQNVKNREKVLCKYIEKFWFAPQDAFLRATETLIWSQRLFNKPVLEIGTGDGSYTELLFSVNKKIDTGIDLDEINTTWAKKTGMYKKVIAADSAKMPLKSSSFSTVISNSTFEHIRYDIKSISEVSRILKRGGHFYFTVPSPKLEKYLRDFGLDKDRLSSYNKRVEHFHYRSKDEWEKIFAKFGMKVIYHHYYLPFEAIKTWYFFHRISTFKPYKRELWSYLKDSPYGKLVPKEVVVYILEKYLLPKFQNLFDASGAWQFIVAQKI